MRAGPPARFQGVGSRSVAIIITAALSLVSAVPLQLSGMAAVTPNLVLMAVFHWTLYYPQSLPYAALFLIGLAVDILISAPGSPFGLTPLLLLLARAAVLNNRRLFIGHSFPFVWAGFGLLAVAITLLSWAGASLLALHVLEPRSFLFQAILTVALFPLATRAFALTQRLVAA